MSHLAFQPRGRTVELDVDFVVVGSGAGGATAAATLARTGASVAIVEAGAWREPKDYPESSYGAMRDLLDDWGAVLTRGRAIWPIVQARAVGGTTLINSAICVRTPTDIFDTWSAEHGLDGGGLSTAVWRAQTELESELSVEEVPVESYGRATELAIAGGQNLGIEGHVTRRYVKGCAGSGQCLQGCKNLRKQSTNVTYVPEVLALGGHVLSCAPVKKVMFEGRTAVGVTGRFQHPQTRAWGATFRVRASRAVVVSASATQSPTLLQRSGVKNRNVGKNFRAHPGTGVFGCYDTPVDMNVGATQGWASVGFRDDPGVKLESLSIPLEMVAGRFGGGGAELMDRLSRYRHIAMWSHAVRANTPGTVRNSLTGRPVVSYTLDRADMERFRQGMVLLTRIHFAAGARAVIPGIYGLPFEIGPDQLHLVENAPLDPRVYFGILSHLFGGCTMGADPSTSVVDGQGRVHGYERLVVADASVIPTVLGVNPQHTIMGLSRHFAERLTEQRPARSPSRTHAVSAAG